MSVDSDLRRLEQILPRLTGDKALRDEAVAIVRAMIDAQAVKSTTTVWWAETGATKKPLSEQARRLVDFVVVNGGATKEDIATNLGITDEYARRLVHRAATQFFKKGGAVTISWDGGGVARTATSSINVSQFSPTSR